MRQRTNWKEYTRFYSKHCVTRVAVADFISVITSLNGHVAYKVRLGTQKNRINKSFKTFEEALAFRDTEIKKLSYAPRSMIEHVSRDVRLARHAS